MSPTDRNTFLKAQASERRRQFTQRDMGLSERSPADAANSIMYDRIREN